MSHLHLSLLGSVAIQRGDAPVTGFKSKKAIAILCYLAVTAQPCPRTTLATLFWGELRATNAYMNLRKVLENLRNLVGPHLVITRQTVAFEFGSDYWLDVQEFEQQMTTSNGALRNNVPAHGESININQLAATVELYRGEFLAGFDVSDAPDFDLWVGHQRTRLRELAVQALQTLMIYFAQADEDTSSDLYARRLLTLEPWREDIHRHLMTLYARQGRFATALEQYEVCCRHLREELAVEPTLETVNLYQRVRTAMQTRITKLPEPTTPFFGREQELALLAAYLQNSACRLITLVGPGGIGKTRLALQSATQKAARFLHGVIYVSLETVTTPALLGAALASALHLPDHPQKIPAHQVLEALQDRELLLVLDTLEHLLPDIGFLGELLVLQRKVGQARHR